MVVTAAGIKLSGAVREKYLAAIMVQDQAFFDRIGAGEVVSRSSKDIDSIRIGLGERVGYLIWGSSTIIAVSHAVLRLILIIGLCVCFCARPKARWGLIRPDPIHHDTLHFTRLVV